jgi:UDP-N-acetylglucosamine--N-acetylmuramyl-(pentapeptide) pyrophosphoryl-undecaprenol N-acetylglucosamine transferase
MFPALALARELMEKGHEAMLLTDERGKRFMREEVRVEVIPATGFFGRSLREKLRALGAYIRGKRRSVEVIEGFKPDVVIGAGGYASLPVIQAAKSQRIPYFLIEQNSVPGRVTRLTAKGVKEIYCGIPLVRNKLSKSLLGKAVVTGNILRKSIVIKGKREASKILVLGGSGGARRLNKLGYELAQKMAGERFVILTGKRDYKEMKAKPRLSNLRLVEFTSHPEELYATAKIAISRAGAVMLSEILTNGIPSILVPFPYAVDDHQTHNAGWAERAGAAVLVAENEIERVEIVLKELIEDEGRRRRMSAAARKLVPTDAAARIAERIERCLAA